MALLRLGNIMCKLKLGSELNLFGLTYRVAKIEKKGVLFVLTERKENASPELLLTLSEVEGIIFNG